MSAGAKNPASHRALSLAARKRIAGGIKVTMSKRSTGTIATVSALAVRMVDHLLIHRPLC
jgi:hypothetical protein